MENLKDYGCDPSCIRIQDINPFHQPCKVKRSTYLRLFEIGFQVNEEDFAAVVSDDRRRHRRTTIRAAGRSLVEVDLTS